MQITSTVSQNKMEPLNGNLNNSAEPVTPADAEQVGGAFCHQFYITVSENRTQITRFYGHESIFQLDDSIVTGPTDIAKQYNLLPESTHFKIHSIKGLPTFHKQGVLVHVIGTANLRPFVQTFVLGQQGQKKYYVEIDNFQYIDSYFENKVEPATSAAAANGHSNGVNGKVTKPVAKDHPAEPQQPIKQTPQKAQQTPKKADEPRQAKQETPKTAEKENKAPKPSIVHQPPPPQHQQAPPQAPVPVPEPIPQEPPKPKTWATLVRGGGNPQPPQQQPNYGHNSQLHQQQLHQHHMQAAAALHQHQQAQAAIYQQAQRAHAQQAQQAAAAVSQQPTNDLHQSHAEDNASLLERKIYLGGITREIVPSNTAQAETEIKQVFYKYGEVEEVRMPRKVLDSPNDTSKHAFAFITMRNKQGVQAIFADATRDDQGIWKLPLKLDAFGFDGLAQISEQRDQPGGGFRGGRGGGFGNRGAYFRRGGPGGAPRGGMRGGYQNNTLNGGH